MPVHVWKRALDGDNTINQQRFHRLVQHIITWFSSRCGRVTPIETNHERTFFVDFIVPIFQYFHDQIQYLQFQWCEVYIQSRKASSGGLKEDIDYTLGDSLKLLEILLRFSTPTVPSTSTRLWYFTGAEAPTYSTPSTSGDGKFLYQRPRTSQIPTTFDERHHTFII
ncbi:hypothetical protein BDC45DRAFT_564841 [Circinella umbellata]|nr:hypothetical protein BDC45DRAFT_564841 [Circinella umbellata]